MTLFVDLSYALLSVDTCRDVMHLALVNVVKGPDGEFTLIDWDGCGMGVRLLDLAYLLFQWLSDELIFDVASAQAFFRTYLSRHSLDDDEFANLLDLSLLLDLNFILFGDTTKKWQKILWLHEHRTEMTEHLTNIGKHRNYSGIAMGR